MSATSPSRESRVSIHPDTSMGAVRLTVPDLARSRAFYENAIGLSASELEDGAVGLGIPGAAPLVELHPDASASPLDRRAPGLFHLAILMPDRRELAMALARLAQARVPLDGASDHLVSEALYLSDPDGNGIEIYRDRPRDEWPVRGGDLQMATLPLDLDSLMAELADATALEPSAPADTRMGHVHLQVSDIAEAERFYSGVLGFDVTVRGYPGALFVSAGGYHHHLGLNTWHSAGSPPATPGAAGLRRFEVVVPTREELDRVLRRAHDADVPVEQVPEGSLLRDPFGNAVLLRTV
ncbi:MAG TPA: VOC family protein [Solirubrobacteraceae bacterium]|jgi:catechol 2,3-dioxygenase